MGTLSAVLFTAGSASAYLGPPTAVVANHDYPLATDFNGDGNDDPAVVRLDSPPTRGQYQWFIMGLAGSVDFGLPGDYPVAGNWCLFGGDCNQSDIAVWRPSNGTWFIHKWNGTTLTYQYGLSGDYPVPFTFGPTNYKFHEAWLAVYRPSNNTYYIDGRGTGNFFGDTTPQTPPFQLNAVPQSTNCHVANPAPSGFLTSCVETRGAQPELYKPIGSPVDYGFCPVNGAACNASFYGLAGDFSFMYDWGLTNLATDCSGETFNQLFSDTQTVSVIRNIGTSAGWQWYIRNVGSNSVNKILALGGGPSGSLDVPVPGHYYDGFQGQGGIGGGTVNPIGSQCTSTPYNGQTQAAVFHGATGFWTIQNNGGQQQSFQWGLPWH